MAGVTGVLAIDIDLGRVTAVHSEDGVICHGVDPEGIDLVGCSHRTTLSRVLIEIAGPVMHHEESHSFRRWLIYNAAVASALCHDFLRRSGCKVLVCPSTVWTKGYTEPERHAIAGILPLKHKTVKGKKVPIYAEPHDVRECRAMIDMFRKDPSVWVPLDQYLQSLVGKPKEK